MTTPEPLSEAQIARLAEALHLPRAHGPDCLICVDAASRIAPTVAALVAEQRPDRDGLRAAVETLADEWSRPLAGLRQRANTGEDFAEVRRAEDQRRGHAIALRAALAASRDENIQEGEK
jgi:hypothetical protein